VRRVAALPQRDAFEIRDQLVAKPAHRAADERNPRRYAAGFRARNDRAQGFERIAAPCARFDPRRLLVLALARLDLDAVAEHTRDRVGIRAGERPAPGASVASALSSSQKPGAPRQRATTSLHAPGADTSRTAMRATGGSGTAAAPRRSVQARLEEVEDLVDGGARGLARLVDQCAVTTLCGFFISASDWRTNPAARALETIAERLL